MALRHTASVSLALLLSGSALLHAQALMGAPARRPNPVRLRTFVPIVEHALPDDVRLPSFRRGSWTDQYAETGLTFLEYVTSAPRRPRPGRNVIYIAPLGNFSDRSSIEAVRACVEAFFCLPTRIRSTRPPLPESTYRSARRQYDADELLLHLESTVPADAFVQLNLTEADLFSGRLSSVFGLAYGDLRACAVSTARLWARPEDAETKDEAFRLAMLAVHEICHSLGLPHCAAHRCRMNGTTGLRDLDNAPVTLCGACLKKLEWNIGFDRVARCRRLLATIESLRQHQAERSLAVRLRHLERRRPGTAPLARGRQLLAARDDVDD